MAGTLCAAAAAFGACASASDSGINALTIQFDVSQMATAQPARTIDLEGRAAGGCAPRLAHMALDGTDLNVELQTPDAGCDAAHPLAFHLRADVAKSVGMPLLPGQVYRVRVFSTRGNVRVLRSFQLVDTSVQGSAAAPENGFWWPESGADAGIASPGSGVSLEWQEGHLAVGLFGFSETGSATWYFGSARPIGRVASVPLVQLSNGDALFAPMGTKPDATPGPRLDLEILSPTRARAWLIGTDGSQNLQVRPLLLARSQFSSGSIGSNWAGQWVLVPDDDGTPRVFDFSDPSSRDSETFHLVDDRSDATLDCRLGSTSRQPDVCTLSANSTPIADFDQIGIDHLNGRGNGGGRMKLVRVPR